MTLQFSNLGFTYQKQASPIIQNFYLTVEKGDIIAIKGASGTGKTTLFRLLLGFEKWSVGNITFHGKTLQNETLEQFRNQTTWLPQDLDLGEGSLEEVFYFPFNFKNNKAKKPSQSDAEIVFDFLGLKEISWNAEFRSLSTGQRQRVGIALCHFLDKDILLLDEPTSALDAVSKEKVKELLFHKNKIILSATHDSWWLDQCTKIVEL